MAMKSILDHKIISSRYFFPRPEPIAEPFWVDCGEHSLACWYQKSFADAFTLIHFHGNGEVVADYCDDFALEVQKLGLNCFLAEYRGYGLSEGQPALSGMLDDVPHIIEATGQRLDKLIVFGRSVGSLYALQAINVFPDIAGCIIESGIADLLERIMLRVNPEEIQVSYTELSQAVARDFNHHQKFEMYKKPVLIMHSQYDGLVDVTHGQRLFEWANEPKEIHIFERGDHNSVMYYNYEQYFSLIKQFMKNLER
ncbi:alpha/beta hydrolase [candidate division CSSED10-310 bacterium]|uniref:Alpha/beta hydrolase n=1 Tax=candidate division CSSED10-310 bacterium TaxID=2855610 RepID=A0ABV6YUF3_UNCC1